MSIIHLVQFYPPPTRLLKMEIGEGLGRPILDHIRMLTFSEQAIKLRRSAGRAGQYGRSLSQSPSQRAGGQPIICVDWLGGCWLLGGMPGFRKEPLCITKMYL